MNSEADWSIVLLDSDIVLRKRCVETKIIKKITYDKHNDITYWKLIWNHETFIIYKYTTKNNKTRYYLNDTIEDREKLLSFKKNIENMKVQINDRVICFTPPIAKKNSAIFNVEALLETLSTIEYAQNTFNNKRHEDKVEEIFQSFGLEEKTKTEAEEKAVTNCYIKQPNGSQNQPDFRIIVNNSFIDIECKSCKRGYKPMWNANYPSKRTVYLYTNKQDNNTLLFLGNTIMNSDIEKIYREYKIKLKRLEKEINDKLLTLGEQNPYGMTVYARNMFVQTKHLDTTKKKTMKQQVVTELTYLNKK